MITKARYGKGGGMSVGYVFDGCTLRFGSEVALAMDEQEATGNRKAKPNPVPRPEPRATKSDAQLDAEAERIVDDIMGDT